MGQEKGCGMQNRLGCINRWTTPGSSDGPALVARTSGRHNNRENENNGIYSLGVNLQQILDADIDLAVYGGGMPGKMRGKAGNYNQYEPVVNRLFCSALCIRLV